MNCLKCGRETQNEAVFCQDCLLEMDKNPVRPGTVVQIQRRKETPVVRKPPKRHIPALEEQIKNLRKQVRILLILLIICIAAIVLMFRPTMHYVLDEHVEIGQNYSTVSHAQPSTAPQNAE